MTLQHSSALPVGSPLIPDNSILLQCSHTSSLGTCTAAHCSHLLQFIRRAISRARPGPWEQLWAWAPRLCAPSLPPHAGLWKSLSLPAAHDLWFNSINSFIPSFLEASWSDFQLLFPFLKDILEYITFDIPCARFSFQESASASKSFWTKSYTDPGISKKQSFWFDA